MNDYTDEIDSYRYVTISLDTGLWVEYAKKFLVDILVLD